MVRLLSIILILLLASPAWAFPPLIAGKTASGGAAALNTVDVSRGFEADSDPAGWSEVDTGSLLSRYDGTVKHSGSYAMSIAGGATTEAYQVYDMGETKAALSACLWFYAPTVGLADTQAIVAIGISGGGTYGIKIYYQREATSNHYHFGMRGATGPTYGAVDVPTGAWYRVEIAYAQNASSSITIFNAAGTQVDTVSLSANNVNSRYFNIGKVGATARDTWTASYYDDLGIDFTDATTPLWQYTVNN